MKSLRFLPVGLLVAFSSSVVLLGAAGFKAKPWTYDPNDTGFAGAAWVTHDGLSDAGGSDHALLLSNSQAGTAAAGATVDIPGPLVLSELGFDYRNDGICTATSPRFVLQTTTGLVSFACIDGTHTVSAENDAWTRVRFDQAVGLNVTGIDIVMDAEGTAHLDNIDINGILIGKPGLQF